jgi:hypothetical protein
MRFKSRFAKLQKLVDGRLCTTQWGNPLPHLLWIAPKLDLAHRCPTCIARKT